MRDGTVSSHERGAVRTLPLLLVVVFSLTASCQSGSSGSSSSSQSKQGIQADPYASFIEEPDDDLRQELDADAVALSKIPSDPILKHDPFGVFLNPFERLTD